MKIDLSPFLLTGTTLIKYSPHRTAAGNRRPVLPQACFETEDSSPILRDDLVMSDYQGEVFGLLVRKGDVKGIQAKVDECVWLALEAIGGVEKPLGGELQRVVAELASSQTIEQFDAQPTALKKHLKDIQ